MGSATVTRSFAVPAAEVWKIIADFNGMNNWHPAVTASTMTGKCHGAVRTLTITDIGAVVESLEEFDETAMRLVYSASELPLPARDYFGTIQVDADGEGTCTITWSGRFITDGAPEEDMVAGLKGFYQAGLDSLADQLERSIK